MNESKNKNLDRLRIFLNLAIVIIILNRIENSKFGLDLGLWFETWIISNIQF
mgnify:CR=1